MVDHFRAFRAATGDTTWDAARTAHQTRIADLRSTYAPSTDLLPDSAVDDAVTSGDPNKIATSYKLNGTRIPSGSEAAFFAPSPSPR